MKEGHVGHEVLVGHEEFKHTRYIAGSLQNSRLPSNFTHCFIAFHIFLNN